MPSVRRVSPTYNENVKREGIYWFIALVMAPVAYFFPHVVTPQFAPVARLVLTSGILFVTAGILGTLAPRRVMRWAMALFVPVPLSAALWRTIKDGSVTTDTFLEALQKTLLVDATAYLVMAAVTIAGTIAGSLMSSD